ncbi:hypothetical protein YB2330_001459 [Saitoella coloradoensis]
MYDESTLQCCICTYDMPSERPDELPENYIAIPEEDIEGPVEVAHMDGCTHMMHVHCLEAWCALQNNCPYCRTDFKVISVSRTFEGPTYRSFPIPERTLNVEANIMPENVRRCHLCASDLNDEHFIYCDTCEDGPWHWTCLGLDEPPGAGTWQCPDCEAGMNDLQNRPEPDYEELFGDVENQPGELGYHYRQRHLREIYEPPNDDGRAPGSTVRNARRRNRIAEERREARRQVDEFQAAWRIMRRRVQVRQQQTWARLNADLPPEEDEVGVPRTGALRVVDRRRQELEEWHRRIHRAAPPWLRREERAPPLTKEEMEEKKAWGMFEKARQGEDEGEGSGSGSRRRSSLSPANGDAEQEQPERKLKRPRTKDPVFTPPAATPELARPGPPRVSALADTKDETPTGNGIFSDILADIRKPGTSSPAAFDYQPFRAAIATSSSNAYPGYVSPDLTNTSPEPSVYSPQALSPSRRLMSPMSVSGLTLADREGSPTRRVTSVPMEELLGVVPGRKLPTFKKRKRAMDEGSDGGTETPKEEKDDDLDSILIGGEGKSTDTADTETKWREGKRDREREGITWRSRDEGQLFRSASPVDDEKRKVKGEEVERPIPRRVQSSTALDQRSDNIDDAENKTPGDNPKFRIERHVSKFLKPYYAAKRITRDQFMVFDKNVTNLLFNELMNGAPSNTGSEERWFRRAETEVKRLIQKEGL